ncbi:unnamed protein product [Periconia digitata]|uniref:Uncharacterized protein n=1 Tax=Periconia digitata TaxID=1303443 RepID=A0A9W4XUW4_9PLEO|nr:unnamed protein product [Periconia digitata]
MARGAYFASPNFALGLAAMSPSQRTHALSYCLSPYTNNKGSEAEHHNTHPKSKPKHKHKHRPYHQIIRCMLNRSLATSPFPSYSLTAMSNFLPSHARPYALPTLKSAQNSSDEDDDATTRNNIQTARFHAQAEV